MTYEKFPDTLPYRPMVGDLVRSTRKCAGGYLIELQVIRCNIISETDMEVELHLVPSRFENITAWEKWYNRVRLGRNL